jgi:hypothetical protein
MTLFFPLGIRNVDRPRNDLAFCLWRAYFLAVHPRAARVHPDLAEYQLLFRSLAGGEQEMLIVTSSESSSSHPQTGYLDHSLIPHPSGKNTLQRHCLHSKIIIRIRRPPVHNLSAQVLSFRTRLSSSYKLDGGSINVNADGLLINQETKAVIIRSIQIMVA